MAKKKKINSNHSNTDDDDDADVDNSGSSSNNNLKVDKNKGHKTDQVNKKKGEKNEDSKNQTTVILKVEMHCGGCASKIAKLARGLEGVENAKAEIVSNKLTVIGKVNPLKIQEDLHLKTKKKVDLISPQLKKEDPDTKKDERKSNDKKPDDNANNTKKPKEPPVTMAVLKLGFHCQGCIEKIQRIVYKTKGLQEMSLDKQKETVTVKGTMDVKALIDTLKDRLKRPVEIVPAKKEKDGGGGGDGDKDEGGEGAGKKKKKGGDGGAGGGGREKSGGADIATVDSNRMEFMVQPGYGQGYGYMGQPVYGNGYVGQPVVANSNYIGPPVYPYGHAPYYGYGYGYGYGYAQVAGYPAHLKFSDENPNACSIM